MVVESIAENKPLHLPSSVRDLPARWSWLRLDDACEGVFDCPHSTPALVDSGPFVARSQDIITGVFRAEQAARVSEETYTERTTRVVPARGDLLYSREGTYFGIAAEVPERTRVCLGQRMVLIRPKPGVVDYRFLRHWLNSPIMASHIHGYRDGTVAERLNLPTIRALPVLVPPLPEQRAIAHILGTLEDKMELNRRMNETLEAMARALFKSWFVDFDPVRAKAEGRDIGLSQPFADLFPDSFEDSELGEIPRGWRVRNVSSVIDFVRGVEPGRGACNEEGRGLPFIRVGDVTGKRISELFTDSVLEPRSQLGDVLLALDGTPGALAVNLHGIFSSGIRKLVPRLGADLPQPYVWSLALSDRFQATVREHARGTTIQHAGGAVEYLRDIDPGPSVMGAYSNLTASIWERLLGLHKETGSLAGLRDTLLPKLVSGELRVEDSARILGG